MPSYKILELKNISKSFPGTIALNEIDFDLLRGEVHAIVGENGAGKSTLMKILSGVYTKDSGTILFEGNPIEINDVTVAQQIGIYMIYQEMENIPTLSVAENIFLGRLPKSKIPGIVNFKRLISDAKKILNLYNINIDPERKLRTLTTGEKQFIEIIRAVTARNPKIIIMDEPTSSLTSNETENLFSIIEALKKREISIIYISHRLDEVVGIADRLSVFRDGKNRGTLLKNEFDSNKIISLMIGHSLEQIKKKIVERKKVVLEIRNLSIKNRIDNFNMKLYEGEVLGIAGLLGSGKDELIESVFGLWPAISKEIYFKGTKIQIRHPAEAIKYGIVYLPEERKTKGLFLNLTVNHNISPLWLFNISKKFIINKKQEYKFSDINSKRLSIKTPSINEIILSLSGGNQQKVVISRLLALNPKLLVLNDPTRGIDVGSKDEIYGIIHELSSSGIAIIILSSEIPEISLLANRVIVLSKGEICAEFKDEEVTTVNIIKAATRI